MSLFPKISTLAIVGIVAVTMLVSCLNNDGLVGDDFSTRVHGTSFFPVSGPVAGGTAITVTGTNFHDGIEVYFGKARAENVAIESEDRLVATLPPGTFGPIALRLVSKTAEMVFPEPFRYSATEVRLGFHQDLGFSSYDVAYELGEFNGDGLPDIVVATNEGLELYLNRPDGFRFHSRHLLPFVWSREIKCHEEREGQFATSVDATRYSLAVLDMNQDGLDDVVVSVHHNNELLHFEAQTTGGFDDPVEIPSVPVFDDCFNRILKPIDLDGNSRTDLLVINHSSDVLLSSSPEILGTVGVLWDFGSPNESHSIVQESQDCTKMHSWYINRQQVPNTARLLCAVEKDDAQELTEIEVSGLEQSLAEQSTILTSDISPDTRFHFVDFERDGSPEYVFVGEHNRVSPLDSSFTGGVARSSGDSYQIVRTFDLPCKTPPAVISGALDSDSSRYALLLCPEGVRTEWLDDNPQALEIGAELSDTLLTPRAGPFGGTLEDRLAMPMVQTLDINADGRDELLLQGGRGIQNLLLYALTKLIVHRFALETAPIVRQTCKMIDIILPWFARRDCSSIL